MLLRKVRVLEYCRFMILCNKKDGRHIHLFLLLIAVHLTYALVGTGEI